MIVAAPLLALVAALLLITQGRPVFFVQRRPGLGGRPFGIVKLRTMRDELGPGGVQLPDRKRITPVGRLLRHTSLDELPELINVLKGEMSLVGPRPLLMRYLPLYTPEQARRHDVRPGVTGWTQVNGRNALTWQEKFRLDVWYVENMSLALDLVILFRTVANVLRRRGIEFQDSDDMPFFTGSEQASGDGYVSKSESSR